MNHNPHLTDWTGYWATGALHSCLGSYAGNYAGAVRAFWIQEWIERLEPTHRTLDLGCGNGPLAQLLAQERPAPPAYLGIDLAAIAPAWTGSIEPAKAAQISFLGSVDMTHTELPNGAFDWAVSQFGAEYANQDKLLLELDRVLSSEAHLVFCMHHAEGRLAQVSREELRHSTWLSAEGGLWAATAEMIEPMALARTLQGRRQLERSEQALRARERFNQAQDQLNDRSAQSIIPDLLFQMREASAQVLGLAQQSGPAAARAAWTQQQHLLRQAQARHQELLAAALSEQQARELHERLCRLRQNWGGHLKRIEEGPYVLGWGFSFHSTRSNSPCLA